MSGREPPASAPAAGHQSTQREQRQTKRRARLKTYCWHFLASIPLVLALLAYNARFILDEYVAYYGYGEALDYELPPGIMDAFRYYDQDGDGYLDPYEFAPLGMMVREEVKSGTLGEISGGSQLFVSVRRTSLNLLIRSWARRERVSS